MPHPRTVKSHATIRSTKQTEEVSARPFQEQELGEDQNSPLPGSRGGGVSSLGPQESYLPFGSQKRDL